MSESKERLKRQVEAAKRKQIEEELERWRQGEVPVHQCDRQNPSDDMGPCAVCDKFEAELEARA